MLPGRGLQAAAKKYPRLCGSEPGRKTGCRRSVETGMSVRLSAPGSELEAAGRLAGTPGRLCFRHHSGPSSPFDHAAGLLFEGQWSEGILHLLRGAALWNTFQRVTETVQEKALAVLCVLNAAMLLGGIIAQRPETFTGMSLLSAALCGGLALWKELWWQWLRRK